MIHFYDSSSTRSLIISLHYPAILPDLTVRYPGKGRLDITVLDTYVSILRQGKDSGRGPLRKNSKINGMVNSMIPFLINFEITIGLKMLKRTYDGQICKLEEVSVVHKLSPTYSLCSQFK